MTCVESGVLKLTTNRAFEKVQGILVQLMSQWFQVLEMRFGGVWLAPLELLLCEDPRKAHF